MNHSTVGKCDFSQQSYYSYNKLLT